MKRWQRSRKQLATADKGLAPGARRLVQDTRKCALSERAEELALGWRQRGWVRAQMKPGRYGETGAPFESPNDTHGDKLILAPRVAAGCTIRTA